MKTSLVVWLVLAAPALADKLADKWGYHDPKFAEPLKGDIKDAPGAKFETTDENNNAVRPLIRNLVSTDYFRYYKVDLSGDGCPFKGDEGMCGNRACAVDPVEDESELPEFWRTQYLSKLAKDSFTADPDVDFDEELSDSCLNDASVVSKKGCFEQGCDEEVDYCYPEDESKNSKGIYVSLTDNPERYTGYAGAHANKIWRAAYLENCFGYHGDDDTGKSPPGKSANPFETGASQEHPFGARKAASELGAVFGDTNQYEYREVGGEKGRLALNREDQCAEQRLFYRLISGMHASVSTHLCYESLNKTTGEWGPNVDCFMQRVGNHPERLQNLYFNYALVQRAMAKFKDYIHYLYFCREDLSSDKSTRTQLFKLCQESNAGDIFDESKVFQTPEAIALKGEFRRRVRNVNQLMECVGCDRCRLWGKIQTAGYGTALKVLLELPEKPSQNATAVKQILSNFRRSELVALVNVYDRLSKSVEAVNYFRSVIKQEQEQSGGRAQPQIDNEFDLFLEGLKYVLRSYVEFPKNCFNILAYHADKLWNKFIGRTNDEPYHLDL